MSAPYTAMQVACWFLVRNREAITERDAELISNMKLQKLLYYAQGAYMAIMGGLLFDDPILAWTHGPVVGNVYHRFKVFGSNGIDVDDLDYPEFDAETEGILAQVYDVFGQYSAWKLREMTHEETPWKSTEQGKAIDQDTIKRYFLENYIDE